MRFDAEKSSGSHVDEDLGIPGREGGEVTDTENTRAGEEEKAVFRKRGGEEKEEWILEFGFRFAVRRFLNRFF